MRTAGTAGNILPGIIMICLEENALEVPVLSLSYVRNETHIDVFISMHDVQQYI